MSIRVSPTEINPTHHLSLRDRYGKKMGLILCGEDGQPLLNAASFIKNPVDTTAQKQTSGTSSYADFDYPYSPIVQDDLSGGRGNLDFERDNTKYYDSFRCRSSRANKAFAGPQEQYPSGLRSQDQNVPGSVRWHQLTGTQRYIYKRFQASASYTVGLAWLLARTKGEPDDLTIAIYSDSAGKVNALLDSVTVAATRMDDPMLSEWLCETVSQAVVVTTYYWVIAYAAATDNDSKHWKIAVEDATGTSYYSETLVTTPSLPTAADFDLYFRLTEAVTNKTCIQYEYKEQQYFLLSGASGAPKLYMAGDRGSADSNAGFLSKLIDGTKSWTTDEWVGHVVKIIDGTGFSEQQNWRVITANSSTQLTVDEDWTITQDTTTDYVILGDKITEITGHGLTAPVTDVLITTKGIVLVAMGDSVNIRRMKEENSAGTWTKTYADDGTNKAVFLDYKPQAKKIVKANNRDGSSPADVSIATADPVEWATASHTFGSATPIDSRFIRFNGTIVYPDENGTEAVYTMKEDRPFIVPGSGNPYPINLPEMMTVRSEKNGRNPLQHNVYLYFPMGYGYESYYSGNITDMGPNLGEGMPTNRRGAVAGAVGYPGRFFAYLDVPNGYSSIMDSGGWHERYRGPLSQRIRSLGFQVIPGTVPDRLWMYIGNDLIYLPFPSDTTNELEDSNYKYTHEFAVTHSRMHSGMFDVMKIVRKLKMQSEALEVDEETGEPICWFELDYRLNEDDEFQTLDDIFNTSPTQEVDFAERFGLAGKRMQFRFRGYTTDNTKTPVFLAIIISAVLRTDVKYVYGPLTVRTMDMEPSLAVGEEDEYAKGIDKQKQLEAWSDASTDSMLIMDSISELFHDKLVFLNPPTPTRHILFKRASDNPFKKDVYVCTFTLQEA